MKANGLQKLGHQRTHTRDGGVGTAGGGAAGTGWSR
jgi:hypothetical protein